MKNIRSFLCLVFLFLLYANFSYTQDTPEFLIDTSIVFGGSYDFQRMPAIAFDGTNYLVVWEDDHSGNMNICGTFVNESGKVINSFGINITNTSDDHFTPDIAFDGTNYLVVWSENRSGSLDIIGTRINTEGVILDPEGIEISFALNDQIEPKITYGGAYYFVAWRNIEAYPSMYGTRISSSGEIQDSLGILISDSCILEPVLACDDTNYLVSWFVENDGYYGSRISQNGQVLDTIEIWTSSLPGGPCCGASLAFDGDNYLFVGNTSGTTTRVVGIRISETGTVIDSFDISSGWKPSVSFNYDHYLVSFKRNNYYSDFNVYGRRIDKSGLVLDSIDIKISHLPTNSFQTYYPTHASDGTNSLVIWQIGTDGFFGDWDYIEGSRVDKNGNVLDPDDIVISTGPQSQLSPSITSDGNNYFVVWKDNRYEIYDIYGARVDQSGANLDPQGIYIHKMYQEELYPKVTFGGSYYLTVWIGYEPSRVLCRTRVNQKGIVMDTSNVVISEPEGWYSTSVATDGDKYLIAAEVNPWNRSDIYGGILDQSGTVINTFPISIIENDQHNPSIAYNGNNYLVVWHNGRSFLGWDIYGTLVDRNGGVLQPDGIQICLDQGNQVHPAVASNGKDFFVVWQDIFESNNTIRGIRVDSSGSLIDPEAFLISVVEGDEAKPTVAFNGIDYIVVWQDSLSGMDFDIYGAKVNTNGNVIDSFIVSNAAGDQLAPVLAYSSGNQVLVVYSGWTGEYQGKLYDCMRIWGKYLESVSRIDDYTSELITEYKLEQCYPNPFNPTTTIKYEIKEITDVELKVFDILGREVVSFVNEEKPAGSYEIVFDATTFPSGVYFYRLQAGSFVETKKMILLK